MKRFEGRTVLITGGNSGIGLACAHAFADEGGRVVITGRDAGSLEKAQAVLGPTCLALRYDALEPGAAHALADEISSRGIRLDAAFMNAGIAKFTAFDTASEALWQQVFDANVKGPYFALQALLPSFNEGSAIVLSGSINAHIGAPGSSIYAASKAALISLARTLSAELLPRGIRVNVVSPGPIATPLYDRLGIPAPQLPDVVDGIRSQVPLKRFGTPAEAASAVTYLASTDAAFIVGSELIVDGGMSQL